MEQSPSWEANRLSASQEIPRIFWNTKAHYHIHIFPPPVPILSQLDPVHTPQPTFWRFIPPSMPWSPKWSFSLKFPHQYPVHVSPLHHTCYMPRPSYSSRFYHPSNIGWGVQIIKLLLRQLLLIPCYLLPPRPKYFPQHPILKHPQPKFLPYNIQFWALLKNPKPLSVQCRDEFDSSFCCTSRLFKAVLSPLQQACQTCGPLQAHLRPAQRIL